MSDTNIELLHHRIMPIIKSKDGHTKNIVYPKQVYCKLL